MAGGIDLGLLRERAGRVLDDLARIRTHAELGQECERLGLPEPPPEGQCTKRERIGRSLRSAG